MTSVNICMTVSRFFLSYVNFCQERSLQDLTASGGMTGGKLVVCAAVGLLPGHIALLREFEDPGVNLVDAKRIGRARHEIAAAVERLQGGRGIRPGSAV